MDKKLMTGFPWDKDFVAGQVSTGEIKTRLDYAKKYVALGWPVFPCHFIKDGACSCGKKDCDSQGKHPLVKNGVSNATKDIAQISQWWTKWPEANIAVATGKKSGIFAVDVDIKPEQGKHGDESLLQLEKQYSKLPDTVQAITGSGGLHYVYLYPSTVEIPNSVSAIGPDIDVRGEQGYIIVEPSSHISGAAYTWEGSSDPVHGGEVPQEAPQWLIDKIRKRAGQTINNAGFICDSSEWSVMSAQQQTELLRALEFCKNELRDDWLAIGMSIHSMDSGKAGFTLWSDWSKTSIKFDAKDQARVWVSFSNTKDTTLNKESIFYTARLNGYKSEAEKEGSKKANDLIDKINNPISDKIALPEYSISNLFPVNNLNRLAGLINAGSSIYSDTATTQAVIALASTVAARRYITPSHESCHLYLGICSGSVGSIGELRYAAKGARDMLHQCGLRRMVRESRLSSALALYKMLWASPASLYLCDDYSAMLKLVQRQTTGGIEVVLNNLTRLYDEPFVQLDSPEDAGIRGHDDPQPVIQRPSLSMLALLHYSQLSIFAKTSELGRGAVEQFLFAICDNDEVTFKESSPVSIPGDLKECIRKIRGVPVDEDELSLNAIFNQMPSQMPDLISVHFSESIDQYDAMIESVTDDRRYRMFKNGARKNMRRLMTVLAAWNDPAHPVADRSIMQWSAQYIVGHLKRLLDMMDVVSSEDGTVDIAQKVLDVIIKQGTDGIMPSYLPNYCRAYKSLSKDKRQELLDKMIDDGDIEMANIKTSAGKIKKRIVYKKFIVSSSAKLKV